MKIKILVENRVSKETLLAEHGLSFWIKVGEREYLFDVGQGLALTNNISELRLDINNLTGVFLSHGHYDHTRGLKEVLDCKAEVKVYSHPRVFNEKYSTKKGELISRGMNLSRREIENFISVEAPLEIEKGLWLTGPIPRENDLEEVPEKYKVKVEGKIKQDDFVDDQALVVNTDKGLVVLLGCTHAGVINTLEYIKEVFAEEIHTVIGGMHLKGAASFRIEAAVDYLAELNLESVVPLHCTGFQAVKEMIKCDRFNVKMMETGDEVIF